MVSKSDASGTTQFAWDFENRLTQVVTPASGSVIYKYDALGRRIQRTPSTGISTNFIYDGQDVVKDINSDGTAVEYLNGPGIDNKIRQKGANNNSTYYFSQDHLGSTTALTGTTGKLVERTTYDGYGNSAGSTSTRYGFTGRERDALTGLLYYRARFYDPQLGRFLSEDPIGFQSGDLNFYVYVRNSPTRLIDPLGQQGRADARWQPGEVEQMRRLADHVRSMGSCPRKTNTYLCCRNIEENALSRLFSQVTGTKHCFLKTGSKEVGMGPAGGGGFPSSPWGGPTEMRDHRSESWPSVCVPICDVDEQCVDRELEIGKFTGKWSLSNNCNTIANDIIKKCKKPCP